MRIPHSSTVAILALSLSVFAIDGTPDVQSNVAAVDRDFVSAAAVAGATEIEASKLALQRSRDKDVRQFAKHMLVEHRRIQAGLVKVVRQVGMMMPPTKPDEEVMADLKQASADTFNHQYLDSVAVKAHMKAVELFSHQAERGQTLMVRKWAASTLPAIQQHFEMGRALAASKQIAQ
ncbi:DUF4142 domain-containing protein [Chitinimonas naiadis]